MQLPDATRLHATQYVLHFGNVRPNVGKNDLGGNAIVCEIRF